MKKFLLFVIFLLLAAAGTAAYLMLKMPETPAGKWVRAQYETYVVPHLPQAAEAEPAPSADAETVAPEVPDEASVAVPDPVVTKKPAKAAPAVTKKPGETEAPAAEPQAEAVPEAKAAPVKKAKPFSKENWYAGKYLSANDVRGKVVLVFVFDVDDERSVAMLPRVQQTWEGFKHKPFTVIGSHRGTRSNKVLKAIKAKKVTFPVYQDAYLPCEPENIPETPYFYVVKPDGKLGFRGLSDMAATEAIVNFLSNATGR